MMNCAMLRRRGAAVASVHPLMTFVSRSVPSLKGVPFALEGDAAALRVARRIVRDLGARRSPFPGTEKLAYHAWGAFLLPCCCVAGDGEKGGACCRAFNSRGPPEDAADLRQTLANYAKLGPAGAFSGPIVRGDAQVVRRHLKELKKIPEAREVYVALARAALRYLPGNEGIGEGAGEVALSGHGRKSRIRSET